MSAEPTLPPSVKAMVEDHRDLNALVRRIKERLEGAPWRDAVVPSLLESLVLHLEAHFQEEESEDGFDEWVALAPHVAARAEALVADHQRLRMAARDFAARARAAYGAPERWEALCKDYQAFYDDLMRHEVEEHRILNEIE